MARFRQADLSEAGPSSAHKSKSTALGNLIQFISKSSSCSIMHDYYGPIYMFMAIRIIASQIAIWQKSQNAMPHYLTTHCTVKSITRK